MKENMLLKKRKQIIKMSCRENSNVRRMHTAVKLNEVGDDKSFSRYG